MAIFDTIKNIFTVKSGVSSNTVFEYKDRFTSTEKILNFFNYRKDLPTAAKMLQSYSKNPIVFSVVNNIASKTSSINRVLLDSEGNISKKESEILKYLDQQKYKSICENLLLTGNCYVYFDRKNKTIKVLKGEVKHELNKQGETIEYKNKDNVGEEKTYSQFDVLHLKFSNVVKTEKEEAEKGLSPLEAAWIVVKSSNEKFNAEASIFKNKGIIGILTNKSNRPMLPDERQRLQGEFDQEIGGSDKYNKIKISTADLNYIQTGMSPTDLKLLDGLMSSLRQICSIYGISSVLFNDLENATLNNVDAFIKQAYRDVYIPLAKKINKELSMFLSEKLLINEEFVSDLNSIDVLKSTINDQLNVINSLSPQVQQRLVEQMTVNELRSLIPNLNDLPEGAETIGQKNNSTNEKPIEEN